MNVRQELTELIHLTKQVLEERGERHIGYWGLPLTIAQSENVVEPNSQVLPAPSRAMVGGVDSLRAEIGECQRCPLGTTRLNLVFGVGNSDAEVMFIGEGPGYEEDRKGEPFVGPAGQLLDKILTSIGLSRHRIEPAHKWVYITNIVKCHPMVDTTQPEKRGNDRPPSPSEVSVCLPFLFRQIGIIRPRFIVTLGAVAARILLSTDRGITGIRGRWHEFVLPGNNFVIRLLPTYHPAALLRNPALKKDVWKDMKMLRKELSQPEAHN